MKSIKLVVIAVMALFAVTSCKKGDNPVTGQASDSSEVTEMSTDPEEGDTIVSQTDSITRTNRSNDMGIEEQEP